MLLNKIRTTLALEPYTTVKALEHCFVLSALSSERFDQPGNSLSTIPPFQTLTRSQMRKAGRALASHFQRGGMKINCIELNVINHLVRDFLSNWKRISHYNDNDFNTAMGILPALPMVSRDFTYQETMDYVRYGHHRLFWKYALRQLHVRLICQVDLLLMDYRERDNVISHALIVIIEHAKKNNQVFVLLFVLLHERIKTLPFFKTK